MSETASECRILLGYNQFLCAEALASGSEFSLSLFEDLNKLIEAVVLYDKIVLLGHYDLPAGVFATPLRNAAILETLPDEKIRPILKEAGTRQAFFSMMGAVFGSISINDEDVQPETILERRISPNAADSLSYSRLFDQTITCGASHNFKRADFSKWISDNIFENRASGGHFYYLARTLVYSSVADACDMDYASDLLRLPIAAVAFTHNVKALSKRLYDALVDKIKSEVDALVLLGMPVAVFVPPLTAKLLSRIDSPNQYAEELLEMRAQFTGFRTAYAEFLAVLKDPTITLRTKIDAKKMMISRITGIIDSGESGHALNVKTLFDKVIGSSLDSDGASAKLSLSGMVSLLLDQSSRERAKGKARALFDLWTDTLNMKEYGALIERSFRTEIDPLDLQRYKEYSEAIRSLITPRR